MFLCISSFRKLAAVSSQQKGRTPTAVLIIFFLFSSMSEDLEILQEACLPSTALGRADAAELQEWVFHHFLHSVFLEVSKKRSTS